LETAILPPGTVRVPAVHPVWTGYLLLSPSDGTVTHEESGNRGTYRDTEDGIAVTWSTYGEETYRDVSGTLTQDTLIGEVAIDGFHATRIGGQLYALTRFMVRLPGDAYEVALRPRGSDVPTFEKIFVEREYDLPQLPEDARTIVDLGANIGLATIFFARRYPRARLLAVEPEPANFTLLEANTAALGNRVRPLRCAAWSHDGAVAMQSEDEQGMALGEWGYRVGQDGTGAGRATPAHRIDTLCDIAGFAGIDILKVDIEGAERDVFATRAAPWLARTGFIVIEPHDRFRPGATEVVRAAVQADFEELPPMGEHLVFRRR